MSERNFYDEVNQSGYGVNRDFRAQRKYSPRYAAEVEVPTAEARFQAEADATFRMKPEVDRLNALEPAIGIADNKFRSQLEGIGASDLETELNRQALDDLRLGGDLNQQQIRESQQSARTAFAARGLENSTPAAAAEILQRDSYRQALQADRRNFALGVDGATNNREQADRSFAMSGMQTARSMLAPRAEIFGPGGSQVSGQSGQSRIGDFLPAVGAIEAQNADIRYQQEQGELNRAAAVNLTQMGFGQERTMQNNLQEFNAQESAYSRELSREEFSANRADSERNSQRNADAAKKANTTSYVSTAATAGVALIIF